MTVTDELVTFISGATPPAAALTEAAAQLDAVRAKARQSGEAVKGAYPGGRPTAMNRAWRTVVSTGEAAGWTAVTATVDALQDVSNEAEVPAAIAVGTAVAEQVAAALRSAEAAARWSHRNVAGLIGAGAAAGRLLRLDETALRHLIGLCATQAAGLASADGTDVGTIQTAKSAADAVEAAILARHGFTSSADGMSGRRGLFGVLAPEAEWTSEPRWGAERA